MLQIHGANFYTVLEASQVLDLTPQTIRDYIRAGKLEGQKAGRSYLIPQGEVLNLLLGKGVAPIGTSVNTD